MAYVSLTLVLIVAAGLCAALVTWLTALNLMRPPRMTDGKALHVLKRVSPDDLGMAYEPVTFEMHYLEEAAGTEPADVVRGWWIPAATTSSVGATPASSGSVDSPTRTTQASPLPEFSDVDPLPNAAGTDRTVIVIHGFADAKVGSIAWAPTWRALGWNVLAIDLRAHGESDGIHCTAGYFERNDVRQVIFQFRAARPEQTKRLVLFGVSLGAAVAAAAAEGRDDVDAVVLDSPFADFRQAAAAFAQRLAVPLAWTRPWAVRLVEYWTGAKFDEVRPIDLVAKLTCPTLVIHGDADASVGEGVRGRFAAVSRPGYCHVVFAGATHNKALHTDPAKYEAVLAEFVRGIA